MFAVQVWNQTELNKAENVRYLIWKSLKPGKETPGETLSSQEKVRRGPYVNIRQKAWRGRLDAFVGQHTQTNQPEYF